MITYEVRIGKIMLPVSPEKVNITTKSGSKTITLLNGEEYNFITAPGLTTVSFDFLLPYVQYPFARYKDEFQSPAVFIKYLKAVMDTKSMVNLSIIRHVKKRDTRYFFAYDTKMDVSIEELSITDDANLGRDIRVGIKLKEFKAFTPKKIITAITPVNYHVAVERPAKDIDSVQYMEPNETLLNFSKRVSGVAEISGTKEDPYAFLRNGHSPIPRHYAFPVFAEDALTYRNENGKILEVKVTPRIRERTK